MRENTSALSTHRYTQIHRYTGAHRYTQVHTSHSNDWHYVTISKRNENVFTWKNKAGVEWSLILDGEESGGEGKFKVKCPYHKDKNKGVTLSGGEKLSLL